MTLNLPEKLVLKEAPVNYLSMFFYSFAILALETIHFHMLLNVTNYLQATTIFSIAMLGIATGSFLGFYILRTPIPVRIIKLICSVGFIVSIFFSYYNITHIGVLQYPYLLILPFIFGTVIVSIIFSRAHSNYLYFTNLLGSATGVVYPIIFVAIFQSENAMFILAVVPLIIVALISFNFKNIIPNILIKAAAIVGIVFLFGFIGENLAYPDKIPAEDYENIIYPLASSKKENPHYYKFDTDFLDKAYTKSEDGKYYKLSEKYYDRMQAKMLLNQLGYLDDINLNWDVVVTHAMRQNFTAFGDKQRILLSEDSMLGRIVVKKSQYGDDMMPISWNGVYLDTMDPYNGTLLDPRVPHIDNAKVFIIGLSADGIVKSAKRLPGAEVSGIEINPIIMRIMSETGEEARYANWAARPYDGLTAYKGEGRSFLEKTKERYDFISLMNIHAEHGPICTLGPESFHTVEGTQLLLNRLTDRGMIVYEEIIAGKRSQYAYFKWMNTLKTAMREMGIEKPEDHIHIFKWDFWGAGMFRTVSVKRTPFTKQELNKLNFFVRRVKDTGWYKPVILHYSPDKTLGTKVEKHIREDILEARYLPTSLSKREMEEEILFPLKKEADKVFMESTAYYYSAKYKHYYLSGKITEEQKERVFSLFKEAQFLHEMDLSPVTDDSPFPFAVYKNKKEIWDLLKIVIFFAMLLFVPVLFLVFRKYGNRRFAIAPPIVYFAIIGFAYMVVEIILMQKFQRFIGAPTLALIVTLGGLLLFSGIGSFVSSFFPKKILYICFAAIPLVLLLMLLFMNNIFDACGDMETIPKMFIAILMLFPVTFLMGIPFPHVTERIKKDISVEYGTLMFGISGAFSTIGATSAILFNVSYGYTFTFIVGMICYALGFGLFVWIMRSKKSAA